MKKFAAVLTMVAFCGTAAFGGTVDFSAGTFDLTAPADVNMDVTLSMNNGTDLFDFADIIIGSNDVTLGAFTYASPNPFGSNGPITRDPMAVYASELWVGGTDSNIPPVVGPRALLGTLTINAADIQGTGTPVGGTLTVMVDPAQDFGISAIGGGGNNEALSGIGTITVVPEPAMLTLMGLGALGLIRRRKA